jgi:hypothetical protein
MNFQTPPELTVELHVSKYEVSEHERTALEVLRARRMQRWADRLSRISDRMSRTARLRLARLP